MKVVEILGIQRNYINIIKAVYSKPIANINLNGQKLREILLKSRTKYVVFSSYLFNIGSDVLGRAKRKLKGDQGDRNWKERSQSIFI